MTKFADLVEWPIAVTEQFPKGLGPTVEELADVRKHVIAAKTQFSMMTPEVEEFMEKHKPRLEAVFNTVQF